MAQPPFERAARQAPGKPRGPISVDTSHPLGNFLRTVLLFEDSRLTDTALPARRIARRGSIATTHGPNGTQVRSALSGTTGTAATPCLTLAPEDTVTSAFTLSALVRFSGAGPQPGSFNSIGAGLAGDDTGRMPLFVPIIAGTFRTRVPAETAFLSAGQPLVASSLTSWHRVTITVSGSTATLYIDGGTTWIGTATQAFANWTLRSVIGSDVTSAIEWPWPAADVFYWVRALTADEVAAHARRPYAVLKNSLTERWLTPTVVAAPIEDGDAWDPVFSDEFGDAIALGVLAQTQGAGRLTANASVVQTSTPVDANTTLDGSSFLHAQPLVLRPTTYRFPGVGSLLANGISTAPHADFTGLGSFTANASRTLRSVRAQRDGVGTLAATPGVRFSVRAAGQGVGSLTADADVLEPFNRGRAAFRGLGSIRAAAVVRGASPLTARIAGAGTLQVGTITLKGAARAKFIGNATLIANPRVRKKPRVRPGIAAGVEPDLVALELETFVPGIVAVTATNSHGTRPHGTLSRLPPTSLEITGLIRASDVGYRSAPTDQSGVIPYPGLLSDAYQIDAGLALEPTRTSASAAWGNVLLANPDQRFDTQAGLQNSDGRSLRLLTGSKRWDEDRQYFTDPTYASLTVLFSALAAPWSLTDDGLSIPLRDATYFLEKPLQSDFYGGGGTSDGTSDLAGKPKPMLRGGTAASPVQNITPTLVDPNPAGFIYQYSDQPGQVIALYEGAATGPGAITFAGDTTNLWAGTTPIGQYRTDNSRGMFQLGSLPVGQITVDAIGQFGIAGPISHPFDICRYLLSEEMALPSSMLDIDSFTTLRAAYPSYVAGVYFGSDEPWTSLQAIDTILASLGANLVPTRDGRLRLTLLRALTGSAVSAATYDQTQIIHLSRRKLPATLDPPPYRFKVGYQHNYTTLTAINTSLATAARQQFVRSPDRFATWFDPTILQAYRRPNDFQPMPGPLLTLANAQDVANALGGLWGQKRRIYDITLPRREFGHEFGTVLNVKYPVEELTNGHNTQVIGYSLRATDATVTYTILS